MNSLLTNPALHNLALLVGRALMSAMFLIAGYGKIVGYAGSAGYMAKMGVPSALLPLVIVTEVVGGLAILLGWQTRLAAIALGGFTLIANLLFHFDWSQPMQMQIFLKNLAVAGGFAILFASGPGAYALDAKRG